MNTTAQPAASPPGQQDGQGEPHDPVSCRGFFIAACVLLLLLSIVYLVSHRKPRETAEPLSVQLLQLAADARQAVGGEEPATALEAVIAACRRELEPTLEINGMASVADRMVESLNSAHEQLTADEEVQVPIVDDGGAGAGQGQGGGATRTEEEKLEAAKAELAALDGLIVEVATDEAESGPLSSSRRYFWGERPWVYLEIFFWALAGVLVHLIVTAAVYMRRHSFFASGIWQHLALMIATPFLTFAFVTLLSLVTLTISVAGEPAVIDLSDPRVLVVVSFLVASRPWGLWDWLKATAKSFFRTADE